MQARGNHQNREHLRRAVVEAVWEVKRHLEASIHKHRLASQFTSINAYTQRSQHKKQPTTNTIMVPVFLIIRLVKLIATRITGEEDKPITKAVTMVGTHVVEQGKNFTSGLNTCTMTSPTVSSKVIQEPPMPPQRAVAACAA